MNKNADIIAPRTEIAADHGLEAVSVPRVDPPKKEAWKSMKGLKGVCIT